ncbi:heparinase II/III domain-containing protein [Ferrimonas senticii]|uniref:heparinase II/III domain-containing protein n=1 Tax=Ferrimonas senticii TaxID=394566 RepID=UPI000411BAE6|nr:heparinase II/III family protein [Ferrimonas senticii]
MEAIQSVLMTAQEARQLAIQLSQDTLLGQSLRAEQQQLDRYLAQPLECPGPGPANGYEHNRHKQNYIHMDLAGRFFLISGDERYANWLRQLLLLYADRYLSFPYHQQLNTNPTGRLFHQILNEHNWLLYASLGYSGIRHWLSDSDRQQIEQQLFEPMLEMFTVKYAHDFDWIHNHGIWAVAAVGICGLAINQPRYVDLCIHGQHNDDVSAGFLAQISQLFAPSGYYIEGPYYHRYAIRPLCLFAEALARHRPELNIFEFNNRVIKTTLDALLACTYPNGRLPALNDASQTMDVNDEGIVIATAISFARYGHDAKLLGLAQLQQQVFTHPAGAALSAAVSAAADHTCAPHWPSVELNEGPNGDRGAQGFLRIQGHDGQQSMAVMNYGQHGMGHGHFDTLGITFFNRGQEVLTEYGFGRWVNVEPKFGGRYLDENKSYARQTIAHNAVTIDGQCQNGFDVERADAVCGTPHFFIADDPNLQGMSAFANDHHHGVRQQRTVLLVNHPQLQQPLLVDLFRLIATDQQRHRYDYAIQYQGQIIRTDFDYHYHQQGWSVLGQDNGYQHLLRVADAHIAQPSTLVSWLAGQHYCSLITSANADAEVIFSRTGGADPSFNLRSTPSLIFRQYGGDHLIASVLESHGLFDEAKEVSVEARGQIQQLLVRHHSDDASIIDIIGSQFTLTVMINNHPQVNADSHCQVTLAHDSYQWRGPVAIRTTDLN